ncbi:MAG TPA: LuxR C-terminal-related transcriptional regulator [Ktedonobacteraceae bacterium]
MADPSVDLPPPVSPLPAEDAAPSARGALIAASPGSYLLTKVTVPPVPAGVLPRSSLIELLERRLPLTLLSAGAGYGKTTLLASWAHLQQEPVAWLTLERLENDPLRFWSYVLLALRTAVPDLRDKASAWLEAMDVTLLPALLTELLNTLVSWDKALILILDDYQVIEELEIGQSLAFLLAHAPACLHLVLATRTDPALKLSRLRAHGQLLEIREEQLQLTVSEARQFLTHTMSLQLAETEVQALTSRTEGWIAGLQLAALVLRASADPSQGVSRISGGHRYLVEYVQEEILASVDPPTQTFLRQVSILDQMTASLCQAVTGEETSAERLRALEQAHLFVLPLDAERRGFRLHLLVRETLLAQMQAQEPERLALLHRRAAQWYAEQQLFPEAITHALSAGAWGEACDLIERSVVSQSWRNAYHSLRGFLTRLPEAQLDARPQLCLLAALAWYMTTSVDAGSMQVVEAYLSRALQGYQRVANQAGVGSVLAQRVSHSIYQGRFSQAFAQAREALCLLPESDVQWRGFGLSTLGLEALLAGELGRAQAFLQQALVCHEASGSLAGRQAVTLWQAEVSLLQGDRVRAAHGFRQILGLADTHSDQAAIQLTDTFGKRRAHIERAAWYSLAGLLFEENRMEEAEHALTAALEGGQFVWISVLFPGLLLQVRRLSARGEEAAASTLLETLMSRPQPPDVARDIQCCQAHLAFRRGDRVQVASWAAGLCTQAPPLSRTRAVEEGLLLARWRLSLGEEDAAERELSRLLEEAQAQQRHAHVLQIQVVQALVFQACGKHAAQRRALRSAVRMAASFGFHRLFLDEGEAMAHLLQALLPELREQEQRAYVRTLLRATGSAHPREAFGPPPASSQLRGSLTPQEQRVLALLAQGASNQEMATALVIGLTTVKSHLSHLLRKLGVTTRTQAIARAQEWGLL